MNPVNPRRLTLIEVLQPQSFKATPERSRVTRTIVQPEIDAFEQMEAQAGSTAEKSALTERQVESMSQARLTAAAAQLAPQLVGA